MTIPLYKKFDGKRYASTRASKYKADAEELAAKARKMGRSARVTQLGKSAGRWKGYWVVWIRD